VQSRCHDFGENGTDISLALPTVCYIRTCFIEIGMLARTGISCWDCKSPGHFNHFTGSCGRLVRESFWLCEGQCQKLKKSRFSLHGDKMYTISFTKDVSNSFIFFILKVILSKTSLGGELRGGTRPSQNEICRISEAVSGYVS